MNEDRYSAGDFNITGEAQHARRIELRRWREGDRTVPPPATFIRLDFSNMASGRWTSSHMNLTRSLADVDREGR